LIITRYVIYLTFPPSLAQQYRVATTPSTSPCAGYVQATNGIWSGGFPKDVLFNLVSTNTLPLTYPNYAVGTGPNVNYACFYNTSFTQIQVNWQTNLLNTNYAGGTSTVIIGSSCPVSIVPFGYSNTCGWDYMTFQVDLRGTNYLVTSPWITTGWPSTQLGGYTTSNNNQTVFGYCNGDCSGIYPALAPNDVGPGGFYIQLAHV